MNKIRQYLIRRKQKINNRKSKFKLSNISKIQQAQLFKAFGQADTSITRQYGGTGLGLVITQKLVEEMQGRIELISIPEQGSTFCFTIVIEKSGRAALCNIAFSRLQKQKVLVFEDNEYAALACTQLLSQWKTEASLAKTEQQWQQLLNKNYDSIVIGYSHCDNLQALFKYIEQAKSFSDNVIILANSSDPSIYETLMATGVTHCLSKPINHKSFANALISGKAALKENIHHKA